MIVVHEDNNSQEIVFILQIQKFVLLFAGCQAWGFRFQGLRESGAYKRLYCTGVVGVDYHGSEAANLTCFSRRPG